MILKQILPSSFQISHSQQSKFQFQESEIAYVNLLSEDSMFEQLKCDCYQISTSIHSEHSRIEFK